MDYSNVDQTIPLNVIPNKLFKKDPATIHWLENLFVLSDGVSFQNGTVIYSPVQCSRGPDSRTWYSSGISDSASSVIVVGNMYQHTYPHSFTDMMPTLALTPRPLIFRSMLLFQSNVYPIVDMILPMMGFSASYVRSNYFVFCHEAFIFDPHPCDSAPALGHQLLRQHFVERYQLDRKSPDRYLLIQRNTRYRMLLNFDEIVAFIRSTWPDCLWEPHVNITYPEYILHFNEAKIVFGMHGGAYANTIFMQNHTVMSEVHGDYVNQMYMIMAISTNKTVIAARNSSIGWHWDTLNYLELPFVHKIIHLAFKKLSKYFTMN